MDLARRSDFVPDRTLFPFESRWFDGPYGSQHYVDEGAGEVIVLAHGNPTWSFLYRKMIPGLVSAGFRCVAPDMLGYGLSEHPPGFGFTAREQSGALLELIRALDLRDLILVGQDWGGPVGLGAIVQDPQRVRGVVLGSTFAWRTTGITRIIGHVLRSRFVQGWMVDGGTFVERVVRGLAQAPLTEVEVAHYRAVAADRRLRRSQSVLPRELIDADAWLADLERSVKDQLGKVPALLIHPEKDGALGKSAVRRFSAIFEDANVVTLPKAGHFFQEDAPEDVVAAIRARFR